VEEKTKKTAAAKTSTKKVEAVSPKEKPTAAKAVKAAATEKSVVATKAAPKAKAASKAKSAAAPVAAEKPAAKKAAASKSKSADAPVAAKKAAASKAKSVEAPVAAEKPAAKKAAASKAKSADAPVAAEKPAAKKAAASKAKSAEAPVAAEKPVAKKAASSNAKSADAPVAAEKPAAKKAAASKAKSAEAPVAAEKPAAKKAAVSKAKSADAPVTAEKPAAKKPAGKSKAIAAEPTIAETKTPSADEGSPKVRLKPRRRELKRLGLLKPKENKKQKRFDDAQKARLEAKENPKAKGKEGKKSADTRTELKSSENASSVKPVGKGAAAVQKPASVVEGKLKRDHKAEERDEPKAKVKGKDSKSKPKLMPEEFGGFQKQISPKAERKNERRKERQEKAEREQDQSHGLFEEPIRLNRFVALSGICSRRDADGLISEGKVKVNGKVVKEMGFKVQPGKDKVVYKDHELRIKVFVYLLMNKPKNKLATTEDDLGRDTVMEIADRYTKARVYPVGRLDRNATGLLLLTNDGDLTKKLTQAGSKFTKIYHVRLDKEISEAQILNMRKGIPLEEGLVKADKVEYLANGGLNELAIQIQSGANHVVKRMVEYLGFEIVTLDRVQFGPLDKRGLPRGTCRLLSEKEVGYLKML
jgi:23S rRNA pseudouridine2605 synthase